MRTIQSYQTLDRLRANRPKNIIGLSTLSMAVWFMCLTCCQAQFSSTPASPRFFNIAKTNLIENVETEFLLHSEPITQVIVFTNTAKRTGGKYERKMKVAELSKRQRRDSGERIVIWRRLLSIDMPHIIVWSADFVYDDTRQEIVLVIGNGNSFSIEQVRLNADPIEVRKELFVSDQVTASPQDSNESKKTSVETNSAIQQYRTSFTKRNPSDFGEIKIGNIKDEWCIRLKDVEGRLIENYYYSKSTRKVRPEILQRHRPFR